MEAHLRDPEIPAGERIVYRGAIGGEPVGSGEQVIERLERDGRTYYRQQLEIAIRAQAHYRVETMFRRRAGAIVCDSYRAETRDGDQLVAIEEGHFRGVRGLAWGGELEHFPDDLTPLLGCAVALRGLDLERGARRSLSLWIANTVQWEIDVRVEAIEGLEVPAGHFDAARLLIRPSFERVAGPLHRLVELLLPPFHVHLAVEPPRPLLRFSFPTGPFRWNPRGVIEAVELSSGEPS